MIKEQVSTMPTYYAQRGDDFLLWQLFLDREAPGYFVEVGALDGLRFSNTYSFEEQGWTGICVEAHPDYIDLLKQNRPNSICIFAAAGESNGQVTLYANKRGALSTLDPSLEDEFQRHGAYFTGFEPRQVSMLPLTQILDEANAPETIDILSIDVEGAEMRVLRGLDWERYQVRVVIVEADGEEMETELDTFFQQRGYHKARNYFGNIFYCQVEADAHIISTIEVNCTTIHTPHPLDEQQTPNPVRIVKSQVIVDSQNRSSLVGRIRKLLSGQ